LANKNLSQIQAFGIQANPEGKGLIQIQKNANYTKPKSAVEITTYPASTIRK